MKYDQAHDLLGSLMLGGLMVSIDSIFAQTGVSWDDIEFIDLLADEDVPVGAAWIAVNGDEQLAISFRPGSHFPNFTEKPFTLKGYPDSRWNPKAQPREPIGDNTVRLADALRPFYEKVLMRIAGTEEIVFTGPELMRLLDGIRDITEDLARRADEKEPNHKECATREHHARQTNKAAVRAKDDEIKYLRYRMAHKEAVLPMTAMGFEYQESRRLEIERAKAAMQRLARVGMVETLRIQGWLHARGRCHCHATIASRSAYNPRICANCDKYEGDHPFITPECREVYENAIRLANQVT